MEEDTEMQEPGKPALPKALIGHNAVLA